MQSLLQTRPENLDDLTIQVALVRPGPIQGGAVHPFIANRQRLREDPGFVPPSDHPLLEEPLRETLGVIVFQDQVLAVATALAGFSIGEAEGLRRAMSRKRSLEAIEAFRGRFVEGAGAQGVSREVAERGLRQARRLLGLRLPEVACGRVRAARVPVGVAAAPLSGRVPVRAPERAADGVLPAGLARAGRAAARGGGALAGREPECRALRARGRGGAGRALVRALARRRGGGGGGRRARARRSVRGSSGARAANRARPAAARGAGRLGRVRLVRPAAVTALGARLHAARADGAGERGRGEPARAAARPDGCDARRCGSTRPGSGCSPTTGRRACRWACTR